VTYSNNDGLPVIGTTANYTCTEGYTTPNSTTRYCNSFTTWNGSEPTCIEIECNSSIDIWNGYYSSITTNLSRYVFGSVLQFNCHTGYNLVGDAALKCLSTGSWNSTFPTCQPVDCKNVSTPDHALVHYPNGTTFQSQAHIQCDPGFNISGLSALTCNEAGLWEPAPLDCTAISKRISSLYLFQFRLKLKTFFCTFL